jgi:sec-independent protein translocase protein TatB
MFDFAWSQIALIAVVALIAIGPKDMPIAIRAITNTIKKARRMAAEFQTHVDDMVRDVNLSEVKDQFNDIRNFNIRDTIEKAVDPDGSLRNTFASDPMNPTPAPVPEVTVGELATGIPAPEEPTQPAIPEKPLAPAFIPPGLIPPPHVFVEAPASPDPPSFIPPDIARSAPLKS